MTFQRIKPQKPLYGGIWHLRNAYKVLTPNTEDYSLVSVCPQGLHLPPSVHNFPLPFHAPRKPLNTSNKIELQIGFARHPPTQQQCAKNIYNMHLECCVKCLYIYSYFWYMVLTSHSKQCCQKQIFFNYAS